MIHLRLFAPSGPQAMVITCQSLVAGSIPAVSTMAVRCDGLSAYYQPERADFWRVGARQ